MSIPTVSVKWLCKVGEKALGRRGRCLPTMSRPTSTPSLTNSRWMRGAPQNELASSSGGSNRGFRHSSWIVQNGVIAVASGCESPCDAIRSRSPA